MWHSFGRSKVYFEQFWCPRMPKGAQVWGQECGPTKKWEKPDPKAFFADQVCVQNRYPFVCILSLNLLIILCVYVNFGQTKGVGGDFLTSRTHWWGQFFSKMSPFSAISRCHSQAFCVISTPCLWLLLEPCWVGDAIGDVLYHLPKLLRTFCGFNYLI